MSKGWIQQLMSTPIKRSDVIRQDIENNGEEFLRQLAVCDYKRQLAVCDYNSLLSAPVTTTLTNAMPTYKAVADYQNSQPGEGLGEYFHGQFRNMVRQYVREELETIRLEVAEEKKVEVEEVSREEVLDLLLKG